MICILTFICALALASESEPYRPWTNPLVNPLPSSPFASLESGFAFGENQYQFGQLSAGFPLMMNAEKTWGLGISLDSTHMFLQVPSESRASSGLMTVGFEIRFDRYDTNGSSSIGYRLALPPSEIQNT